MRDSNGSPFRLDADLVSLRALVAIADEGSFSAAARRIGRTQSAVSLQIAKLEDRVQARLLERTSRSVRQTPAGEVMTAYARRILDLADEALLAISAPEASEPLSVGFADYLAPSHLHDLLARFGRAHPKAGLELRLGTGHALQEDLTDGQLDVVVSGPEGPGGRILLREPLLWVGSLDGDPDAEGELSLVLMEAPCSYRQSAFDALTAANRPWCTTTEVNSSQAVQSAVAAGLGVSVLPRSALTRDMRVLGAGFPPLPDTAIVAFVRPKSAHPLTDRFLAFLEDGLAAPETFTAAIPALPHDRDRSTSEVQPDQYRLTTG